MAQDTVDNLTPRQEKTVIALLTQPSVTKAAEAAGVGQRTIYRWLDDPDFARAYRKARRNVFDQAIAVTQRLAGLAVNTLARVMSDANAPASARVQAASTLLRFAREAIELDDLAVRVEALEQVEASRRASGRAA